MSFDDFVSNLQSDLSFQKMPEFYDMHVSQFREMQPHQRRAHIASMKASQKQDYKADLRVVIDERDTLRPGGDPWTPEDYETPDLDYAIKMAIEVVVRRDGREFVAKSRDGNLGFR